MAGNTLAVIIAVYVMMSLITMLVYAHDKRSASRGGWRVSERTLHTLELLCGWPGALLAQSLFRHKRRKVRFMLIFVAIMSLHLAGWIAYVVLWRS